MITVMTSRYGLQKHISSVIRSYGTEGDHKETYRKGITALIVKPLLPAYGGYTVARDDKIILVKGAIPGEVVEVTVQEKKRDYTLAAVSQVVEPSEYRVEPKCPVFGVCGGCHLQYVSYERQLSMKEEVLVDSLCPAGRY